MFDSKKSKQQAKIVLQQLQKHTNESLRSLALRIETLVKTAYSLYTEDYRNSVMNQTFIRCLDNELKTAALKKHANHKQTPREPEMPFKALVDKIDQTDLTRTITNNHKRLYEINQTTNNINDDLKQMNVACNNINDLNQNDLEQFEGTICNVQNGINNTYGRKNFKGRPKFALFCSYCSSHGHTISRCFKRPRRESIPRPKEKTFYEHMRNNQNLPNRRIDSNNVNGRQLTSTSPVYNSSRSRTPYRSQSRNNYNNTSHYNRNNDSNNKYNSRNTSYRRNNFNRSRTNSYNRNNSYNRYNNSRSNSRYTNRSQSRHQSTYNRNNNNNYYNKQRFDSRDSNRTDRYRQRSNSNNRHYSNNNNRTHRRNSSHREQSNRHQSKDGRTDGNRYNNNHNKGRINNVETDRPNEDPPGIDEYEYTSESSNEDQEILDKFYDANEDTCNTIVNALESNPTWILPKYQCNKFERDFTKQKNQY